METPRFNGLMIDCSRLMEPHDYYFKLVDFMADWGMNTLLFHFSDDHGCGVALPGFERIAMPNAFTVKEMAALIAHATSRGVDVIPELEAFGHTRFLTDLPEFEHLYAGTKKAELTFNALDPLNPKCLEVVRNLIAAVCKIFTSRYLHIGCDEVDLTEYCKGRDLNEEELWAGYVNKVIGMVVAKNRMPMLWGDHPTKSERIAQLLRKDVVLVDWRYYSDVKKCVVRRLRKAGFHNIICAPAIAWWGMRFFPSKSGFVNTTRMCRFAADPGVAGVINTVWVPFRYYQQALWYAIAYSARCAASGGNTLMPEFRAEFAATMFDASDDPELEAFLTYWPDVEFDGWIAGKLIAGDFAFQPHEREKLERARGSGLKVFAAAAHVTPRKNKEVFDAMLLSARAAWVCIEYCLLASMPDRPQARVEEFNAFRADVWERTLREWDRTRFPNDPQKLAPKFPNERASHAICLLDYCKQL